MRLSHNPAHSIPQTGAIRAAIATFADSAPDIGRHVRGLLFVGYSPDLTVVWRQRIALQDDTDAVDTDALFPEFASLLTTASIGRLPTVA